MGVDIYLVVKTEPLPRLPVEVVNHLDLGEDRAYSLDEIRKLAGEFEEQNDKPDPDGSRKEAISEFVEACVNLWDENGWVADEGANFLVSA